jgi:hypothetical protein
LSEPTADKELKSRRKHSLVRVCNNQILGLIKFDVGAQTGRNVDEREIQILRENGKFSRYVYVELDAGW